MHLTSGRQRDAKHRWRAVLRQAWKHTSDTDFVAQLEIHLMDEPAGAGILIYLLPLALAYGAALGVVVWWVVLVCQRQASTSPWGGPGPYPFLGMAVGALTMAAAYALGLRRIRWESWLLALLSIRRWLPEGVVRPAGIVPLLLRGLGAGVVAFVVVAVTAPGPGAAISICLGLLGVLLLAPLRAPRVEFQLRLLLLTCATCGLIPLGGNGMGVLFFAVAGAALLPGGATSRRGAGLHELRDHCWWWPLAPHPIDVEEALAVLVHQDPIRNAPLDRFLLRAAEPLGSRNVPPLLHCLHSLRFVGRPWTAGVGDRPAWDWIEVARVCHTLVNMGEDAVPALQQMITHWSPALRRTGASLLEQISRNTLARLDASGMHLFCSRCLATCSPYVMAIDRGSKVTFYRCRLCGESHGMVDVREVLCVLDYRMTEKQEMVDGSLRINWHKHGGMFDFDRIEIIRATDEDVMRLAMDAGNDIDPHRFPHYAGMPCYIDPECSLSENVRRILQDRFGKSC